MKRWKIVIMLSIMFLMGIGNKIHGKMQLPDLSVDDIWIEPDSFHPNDKVKIWFRITNRGDAPSGGFYIELLFDSSLIRKGYLPGLDVDKGYEISHSMDWPDDLYFHRIDVYVDIYNDVIESNENNNHRMERFKAFNRAPNKPFIDGPTKGLPKVTYNFTIWTTDPENDLVKFYIEWGDLNTTLTNFVHSGEKIVLSHSWMQLGNYTIRVKAIDKYDAESNYSEMNIMIGDDIPPKIDIVRPKNGLYIFDKEILKLSSTIIIGGITIRVNATDDETGIATVSFYINDVLKFSDNEEPYEWQWDEKAVGMRIIKAIAYDNAGNSKSDEVHTIIINL